MTNEDFPARHRRGTVRDGILMLKADEALAVITDARDRKIAILGIDGFFLAGGITRPSLEHSVDFSTSHSKVDTHMAAMMFIERFRDAGLHFEIVLGE